MPLAATADKKMQIGFINKLEMVVQGLLDYANGDEDALTRINAHLGEVPTQQTLPEQQTIQPEAGNVVQMPSPNPGRPVAVPLEDQCTCPIAVLDSKSATKLCVICQKNGAGKQYFTADSTQGRELIRCYIKFNKGKGPNKDDVRTEIAGISDGEPVATVAPVVIPEPAEFAPYSGEDVYAEDQE